MIEKCVNRPLAPPDSFQMSITESSACNLEEDREAFSIQIKQDLLQKFQKQQIEIVLKQQKPRIFSAQKEMPTSPLINQKHQNPFSAIQSRRTSGIGINSKEQCRQSQDSKLYTQVAASLTDRQSILIPPKKKVETMVYQDAVANPYCFNKLIQISQRNLPSGNKNLNDVPSIEQLKLIKQCKSPTIDNSTKINMLKQTDMKYADVEQNKIDQKQQILTSTIPLNSYFQDRSTQANQICESQKSPSMCNIQASDKIYSTKFKSQDLQQQEQYRSQYAFDSPKPIFNSPKLTLSSPIGSRINSEIRFASPKSALSTAKTSRIQFGKYDLIKAILSNDVNKMNLILQDSASINEYDELGNTPLILIIKLCGFDQKYHELLKAILKFDPDPFKKNQKSGWSPMDESLSQKSVFVTAMLFQQCYRRKRIEFLHQCQNLQQILLKVPDFSIDLQWNFDSLLPLVKQLAPSDTIKLMKYGDMMRLDSTLAGFSNLQYKRRDITLLFRDQRLRQINWTNKFQTDPFEELDFEEKKLIINDILSCEPVSGEIEILNCELNQSYDWKKRPIVQYFGIQRTERYDLKIQYKSRVAKKLTDTQSKFAKERLLYTKLIDGYEVDSKFLNTQVTEQIETRSLQLWICRDHPLQFQHFSDMLTILSKGNPLMEKLQVILQRNELKCLTQIQGFPIKMQIPFQFAIYVTVLFQNFQPIFSQSSLFSLPDIPYLARKVAQKTIENKKKRLLLANLYL